ncbi:MAG: hypothetical protein A3E80_03690 [Chlamydiae bacterium RIFCSPHIGHO2_12_FULL_49_9]|nr:MAG: hypothetical protein A3E80_03690 [Chlamydiae bacterium RIFCSPHIGHO2_12_FULL_49_9]
MAEKPEKLSFLEAKEDTIENLDAIKFRLNRCIEEGMIDEDAAHYNELLDLLDEALLAQEWDELLEAIAKAKTLEIDIASWLARHGQTSISLPWPKRPSR